MTVKQCCGLLHPWDARHIENKWVPENLRVYIIGENPGDANSAYFYDPPPGSSDPIWVRRNLLSGLYKVGLIQEPTLTAFFDAGFLFDHAIRCPLPADEIKAERRRANTYSSPRAEVSEHIREWASHTSVVWAMGQIARNSVTLLFESIPRDCRKISEGPYEFAISDGPTVFVSQYLTHMSVNAAKKI